MRFVSFHFDTQILTLKNGEMWATLRFLVTKAWPIVKSHDFEQSRY